MSKKFLMTASVFVTIGLVGCAADLVKVKPGSERVSMASANQVTGCASLGKITVNVLATVGPLTRSIEAVDADLFKMGQNNAVDLGGDTIVKDNMPEFGKQTYAVYKCRN